MDTQAGIQIKKKQESPPLIKNIKEPRFLLMYSPQRFDLKLGAVKPEITLGNLYLAGALRDSGFSVTILDCCLGNERYTL